MGLNFPLKFKAWEFFFNEFQLFSLWEQKNGELRSLQKGLNLCNTGHALVWSAMNWCNDSIESSRANLYIKYDRRYLHGNYNLFRYVENNFKGSLFHIREIWYPTAVLRGSLHSWFVSTAHGVTLTPGYYEVNTNICIKQWLFGCLPYLAVYVRLFTAE